MDGLISQFCVYFALLNTNMNTGACQAALNATYSQTGAKSGYDLIQNTYTKKGQDFIKDNVNDQLVYGAVGLYALDDAYKKKEIKLSTKCNMFLCDSLSMDLTQTNQSYSLGWKWNF